MYRHCRSILAGRKRIQITATLLILHEATFFVLLGINLVFQGTKAVIDRNELPCSSFDNCQENFKKQIHNVLRRVCGVRSTARRTCE